MLELTQGRKRPGGGRAHIHGRQFRHHHRRRRRRRLRAGEPALGALGPFRAAARSRPRHAARPRARRRARYLSGVLLQRRLFLAGAEGALAARQQFAAHRLFAGPHHGRRLLGDGHGGAPRHARRLRRMGGARRHRLGLERRAAVLPQARDRQGLRRRHARHRRPGADLAAAQGAMAADLEGAAEFRRRAADPVRRRHERGFPRRLRGRADQQLAGQAGLGRDLLSHRRRARAKQSHHRQRRDGDRHRVRRPPRHRRQRRHRRRNEGVHRPRDHRQPRRHPFAGHADALRHRPGARICASTASRCAPTCRASAPTCPTIRCCSSAFI